MASPEKIFEALMKCETPAPSADQALENIGLLVDLATDLRREDGLNRALSWCDTLEKSNISDDQAALLEYFRSNAWDGKSAITERTPSSAWAWEQPNLQRQILHLRRARNHAGFEKLSPIRRCQVLTNLGNAMNTAGRFAEAFEYWDAVLSINPRFGMVLGNRAYGLMAYARALYDPGHQGALLNAANDGFTAALSKKAFYEGDAEKAKDFFLRRQANIQSAVDLKKISRSLNLDGHSLGRSEVERQYRQWCLRERLFLNPLNDLGAHAIAARDVLTLPTFATPLKEPPSLIGLFNQMKQEFVSARWLYHEGVHRQRPHFSDKDVWLYNTLDYPAYGVALEKIKASYRAAYSILDKLGFFLNSYLALAIPPDRVNFRTVWYSPSKAKPPRLRPEFSGARNWPLRGLFWLSKDLFDPALRDVTAPDAQSLHEIRNHLEHKYLKVHEMAVPSLGIDDMWNDHLAYSVLRTDFEAKALRVLKLARAGLLYLSLGMHAEERLRAQKRGSSLVAPMSLGIWDDRWKR